MAGGEKTIACASGSCGQLRVQLSHDDGRRKPLCVALVPGFERKEIKGVVGGVHRAEKAVAGDRRKVRNARRLFQDRLDLRAGVGGALERRSGRKLHVGVEVALVLFGNEARREPRAEKPGKRREDDEERHREKGLVDQVATAVHVAIGRPPEPVIEPAEEDAEGTARLFARLQQKRGERGRERQRIEGRDDDRKSDGDGELLVEATGDARDERRRDEDRGQNQRDGDDRARHLGHRFQRGVAGREALFDMVLDRLDDDDGVVDDEADREHQPEERERVDRETEEREDRRTCRPARPARRQAGSASRASLGER